MMLEGEKDATFDAFPLAWVGSEASLEWDYSVFENEQPSNNENGLSNDDFENLNLQHKSRIVYDQLLRKFQKAHPSFAGLKTISWNRVVIEGWPEEVFYYSAQFWQEGDADVLHRSIDRIIFRCSTDVSGSLVASAAKKWKSSAEKLEVMRRLKGDLLRVSIELFGGTAFDWPKIRASLPGFHLSMPYFEHMNQKDFGVIERATQRLEELALLKRSAFWENGELLELEEFPVPRDASVNSVNADIFSDDECTSTSSDDSIETEAYNSASASAAAASSSSSTPATTASPHSPDNGFPSHVIEMEIEQLRDYTYDRLLSRYQTACKKTCRAARIAWSDKKALGWPKSVTFYIRDRWSREDCFAILRAVDGIKFVQQKDSDSDDKGGEKYTREYKKDLAARLRDLSRLHFGGERFICWESIKKVVPSLHLYQSNPILWKASEVKQIERIITHLDSSAVGFVQQLPDDSDSESNGHELRFASDELRELRKSTHEMLVRRYRLADVHTSSAQSISWNHVRLLGWPQKVTFYARARWSKEDCQILHQSMQSINFIRTGVTDPYVDENVGRLLHQELEVLCQIHFKSRSVSWEALKEHFPNLHMYHSRPGKWSLMGAKLVEQMIINMQLAPPGSLKTVELNVDTILPILQRLHNKEVALETVQGELIRDSARRKAEQQLVIDREGMCLKRTRIC